MSKLLKRIEQCNTAFQLFKEGLILLKTHANKTDDVDTYIWKIEHALNEANKAILKAMQTDAIKEVTDDEFNQIVKKFKRRLDN